MPSIRRCRQVLWVGLALGAGLIVAACDQSADQPTDQQQGLLDRAQQTAALEPGAEGRTIRA